MNKLKNAGIYFVIALLSMSCTKKVIFSSESKLYETFYIGDNRTQYFVKPLKLSNSKKRSTLHFDYTFRYKDKTSLSDTANVHFTLSTKDIVRDVDSIVMSAGDLRWTYHEFDRIYIKHIKSDYVLRYSTIILLQDLKGLFGNNQWKATVYPSNSEKVAYYAVNRTKRKIGSLSDYLFYVLD
jgi:hypothetical protein